MTEQHNYQKGDRIRVIHGSLAAPEGTEATVISVQRDDNNTILSIDIFIDADHTQARGTSVYPREIELIAPSNQPT